MGRKRKVARKTTGQGVISLHYTRKDFEQRHRTVIDYTEAIRSRNWHTNQRELTKEEVTEQFTISVLGEYATTEARCFDLLGQVESPAYHNYWAKFARQEAVPKNRQKIDGTSFWITRRKLRPALVERYPDCITLENEDLGLVIVPGIALRSLNQISYKETLRSIFGANAEIDSLHVYTRQLWVAIISLVYHFEDAALRDSKLTEMSTPDVEVDNLVESYRLSHQDPSTHGVTSTSPDPRLHTTQKGEAIAGIIQDKGEKRHSEEEPVPAQEKKGKAGMKDDDCGKEDVDAEDQGSSRKRQKRTELERGGWQNFGAELDSAGATMSPFPISLDFADTNLPFRFKE